MTVSPSIPAVAATSDPTAPRKLIVYACPVGALGEQLDVFFGRSAVEIGRNTAHDYMPHCTLTGFFHDVAGSVPIYVHALREARAEAMSERQQISPALSVTDLILDGDFHYLKLEDGWIRQIVQCFSEKAQHIPTRADALRLKDWLHLSLAYGFPAKQGEALRTLAREIVDPTAPVDWELRLYERLEATTESNRIGVEWRLRYSAPLGDDSSENG